MSITAARDEGFVELLQRSGCAGAPIGFESLREEGLAAMRKPFNLGPHSYRQAMANLRRRGIGVFGTFVFGYEHDSAETVAEALEFAQEEGFYLAAFNIWCRSPAHRFTADCARRTDCQTPNGGWTLTTGLIRWRSVLRQLRRQSCANVAWLRAAPFILPAARGAGTGY